MTEPTKYLLGEDAIPSTWYNIQADLPSPPPPVLHPGTHQQVGPDDLAPLFPMALIGQEVSTEREIEIPLPVREVYRAWRPTPLYRARRLEQALGTPARIYYKYEGVSPTGSHKPNTAAEHREGAMAEALRCKDEGSSRAILFNLCGHGHFDMQAYTDYFAGNLAVDAYDESEVAMALAGLPAVA